MHLILYIVSKHLESGTTAKYSGLVFHQALIVATHSSYEQQTMNTLEAVHPLLPFWSLTADVKHVVWQLTQIEQSFCYTCCSQARSQDILVIRYVVTSKQPIDILVVAVGQSEISNREGRGLIYYEILSCNANSLPRFMVRCTEGSCQSAFIASRHSTGKLSSRPISSWFAMVASYF